MGGVIVIIPEISGHITYKFDIIFALGHVQSYPYSLFYGGCLLERLGCRNPLPGLVHTRCSIHRLIRYAKYNNQILVQSGRVALRNIELHVNLLICLYDRRARNVSRIRKLSESGLGAGLDMKTQRSSTCRVFLHHSRSVTQLISVYIIDLEHIAHGGFIELLDINNLVLGTNSQRENDNE